MRAKQAKKEAGSTVTDGGYLSAFLGLSGGLLRATSSLTTGRSRSSHPFDRWLDIEESFGVRSTFFFPPSRTNQPHVTDPVYRYGDEFRFEGERYTVREFINDLDARGWEVGLHPTWNSYDDVDELQHQKNQLESAVGNQVASVRQHYLHYDIRRTPKVHDQVGFKYDSTLGFTGNVGFRFGTSYPWALYDQKAEEHLDILEIPLIAQDTNLFDEKQLGVISNDVALQYIDDLADTVSTVSGVLTLNFHPGRTSEERFELYERILRRLQERGAWFATISEVGRRWKEHGPSKRFRE